MIILDKDLEIEQRLLKSCIDNPEVFDTCVEVVTEDLFALAEHKEVWKLLESISDDGEVPTRERVEVRSNVLTDRAKTALYVILTVEPIKDVSDAVRVLKECEYRRRIKAASQELYRRAEAGRIKDLDHLLVSIQSLSDSVTLDRPRGILSPRDICDVFIPKIEEELKGQHNPTLMSTGVEKIDLEEI